MYKMNEIIEIHISSSSFHQFVVIHLYKSVLKIYSFLQYDKLTFKIRCYNIVPTLNFKSLMFY